VTTLPFTFISQVSCNSIMFMAWGFMLSIFRFLLSWWPLALFTVAGHGSHTKQLFCIISVKRKVHCGSCIVYIKTVTVKKIYTSLFIVPFLCSAVTFLSVYSWVSLSGILFPFFPPFSCSSRPMPCIHFSCFFLVIRWLGRVCIQIYRSPAQLHRKSPFFFFLEFPFEYLCVHWAARFLYAL